jgi:hypothetical protein
MLTIDSVRTMEDLEAALDQLEDEVKRLNQAGGGNVRETQRVVNWLTRVRLVMNEIERTAVRERGVSRELADRFIVLEGRIRSIGTVLAMGMQNGHAARE